MMFHVVPVEVGEEFPEPIVHNMVIAPTIPDFNQKCRATLCRRVLNGEKDGIAEVRFNSFTMSNEESMGPVEERSALGTHIIA
jgi:hypothetical protein